MVKYGRLKRIRTYPDYAAINHPGPHVASIYQNGMIATAQEGH